MLLDRVRYLLKRAYYQVLSKQQDLQDAPVERKRTHKRSRWYFYNPAFDRSKRLTVLISGVVLTAVFLFSASQLLGYAADYLGARRASDEMRQAYYEPEETTEVPGLAAQTAVPEITAKPVVEPAASETARNPVAQVSPAPVDAAQQRLPQVKYPNNAYNIVSSRFQKLKRQNQDIVGWLTIDGMLDEAVVQRDNEYYLKRDYLGYHNVNGAIFLDENCDLRSRPYTLMLYGHNMKSGLMFGGLRNYENPTYYHNNPFITFDTAYEDGRYVVFSVATISLDAKNWRFVNLSWLISSSVSLRSKAISSLNRFSIYQNGIDVEVDDQLLLLITCVDEPSDRRIITARRIRDGESEAELHKKVRTIRLK